MALPLYQIDAFADRLFAGNPAAVMPLERWPEDSLLQSIAQENNLSETAYLVPDPTGAEAEYELRWFTPVCEVALCGHATLASAHVIFARLRPELSTVRLRTRRSGILTVTREADGLLVMDFPVWRYQPVPAADSVTAAVTGALGVAPLELFDGPDMMAVLADEAAVAGLRPDLAAVAALETRGLIVTAPGREVDFVSRFFAPKAGIAEDPVTGSAHCMLTPYWVGRLGRNPLRARQISARGGDLRVRLDGDRVELAGRAALFLEGQVHVDS